MSTETTEAKPVATESKPARNPFEPGDRVVHIDEETGGQLSGPIGTVQNIRIETIRSSLKPNESEPLGMAITVLWDNGTISHFVPQSLKKV